MNRSVPMVAIHRPTSIDSSALVSDSPASSTTMARPSTISAKYSGALNASDSLRQRRRHEHQRDDAEGAGDERSDRGHAERSTGAALARHLVAVEASDDRGRFARHVEQDRGRRAAVLRAVVDAGQHDHRAGRIELERQRQQHRDRRRRSEAGQHADHGAEEDADEAHRQVRRRQRDRRIPAAGRRSMSMLAPRRRSRSAAGCRAPRRTAA